jgi:hypothetical protein
MYSLMNTHLHIQIWGGIGDVLRELAFLPLETWRQRYGAKIHVWHWQAVKGQFHPEARVPTADLIADLLRRWPGVEFCEGTAPRGTKVLCKGLRRGLEITSGGRKLFAPPLQWLPADTLPSSWSKEYRNIVVQPHLIGLPSKRWGAGRWREILGRFAERLDDGCRLHVLDPGGAELAGCGAVVHDGLSLPQAIRMVSEADALIAVDSWSKYVAGWQGISQFIIVPDQRGDYPQLTAESVWRHSFRGLHENPKLRLLGLERRPRPHYTMGTMDSLEPERLWQEVAGWAEEIGLFRSSH